MTGSSPPKWQRSSIGITPLTVRPRPGSRLAKKYDVVGTGTPPAEKRASNGAQVNIIFPGIGDKGREEGAEGRGSSGSRRAAAGRVCSVCTRASADYSCPRCLVGYCSSKCYKVRHRVGCATSSRCYIRLVLYRYQLHLQPQQKLHLFIPNFPHTLVHKEYPGLFVYYLSGITTGAAVGCHASIVYTSKYTAVSCLVPLFPLFFLFFFFPGGLSFSSFSLPAPSVFSLSMYLGCWRPYVVHVVSSTVRWHGMVLHCLLPSQHL